MLQTAMGNDENIPLSGSSARLPPIVRNLRRRNIAICYEYFLPNKLKTVLKNTFSVLQKQTKKIAGIFDVAFDEAQAQDNHFSYTIF